MQFRVKSSKIFISLLYEEKGIIMEKRITGDTLQRYSFRKLSVGLVSATIGSFFLSTAIGGNISTVEAAEVSAGKNVPIQYHYVVES